VVANRLAHQTRGRVQQLCLGARQFGVALPGGAEGLIHWRTGVEKHLAQSESPLAVIDVDFANAYPSLEWDSIRSSVDSLLPEVSPWTHWCHTAASQIELPSGDLLEVDRGAEQGDPLGPIYCALVLLQVAERARATLLGNQGDPIHLFDAWYLDDGQYVSAPMDAGAVLRVLDEEADKVGAFRSRGEAAKSAARLVGSPMAQAACGDWQTEYVRSSTTIERKRSYHVLGVDFGAGDRSCSEQFRIATASGSALHEALASIDDVGSELVLLRSCADV
jgi:hypothetical protein